MTDPRVNTNMETKKIVTMVKNKPKPGQDVDKEANGIPDVVKGIIAVSAKLPEMNDPTGFRTDSDDEDLDFGDWEPPKREEVERAIRDMADRKANTDEEKKKMDQNKHCKANTEQKAVKKGDGISDNVKGAVAASVKRPVMNDPTPQRTESDDEDMDPIEGWKPPSKEEEDKARREK